MKWRNAAALLVLLLGLTQMAGDLFGNRALQGLGAASVIAPCPKVFGDLNGMEPFASTFVIEFKGAAPLSITPEIYARLKGPYNRRNVYGAALAAAPRLPEAMREAVFRYAFAPEGPLRRELGLPPEIEDAVVVIRTQTRGRNDAWTFELTD